MARVGTNTFIGKFGIIMTAHLFHMYEFPIYSESINGELCCV
jgi:hypothetical protein